MFGSDKNKDYEAVPDVEKGTAKANNAVGSKHSTKVAVVNKDDAVQEAKKNKEYADLNLNDDQAGLLGTLDQAINSTSGGDVFQMLPASASGGGATAQMENLEAKIQRWMFQAREFAWGLLQPTLTALVTVGLALYLRGQEEGAQMMQTADSNLSFWSATVIPFMVRVFPYFNATIMFVATVLPLQKRIMEALVTPTFATMEDAEETLQQSLGQLGPVVDETIDGIQADFDQVMKPIQPKLDQISGNAYLLEQVLGKRDGGEDVDIPDPSDIHRELDEVQGIVTDRMDKAQDQLQFENYVPTYMKSPKHFYWKVVVPVLVLAWIVQMAVAYAGSGGSGAAMGSSPVLPSTPSMAQNGLHRALMEDLDMGDVITTENIEESAHVDDDDSGGDDDDDDDQYTKMLENATTTRDVFRDETSKKYQDYKLRANHTIHSLTANITNRLHGYEQDAKAQYQQYKNDALVQSDSMIRSVLWSYGMAALQMLLMYLLTNKAIRAWIVRQGMKQIQNGAKRTLDDCGVTAAVDDVFGTRIPKIRSKVLKLIQTFKKVEQYTEKAGTLLPGGAAGRLEEAMSGGQQGVKDAMAKVKGNKHFGKFF